MREARTVMAGAGGRQRRETWMDADRRLVQTEKKKVNPINSVIFVLFDKYYPNVDKLGSKDSSHDFQLNCIINFFFTYI